MIKIAYTHDWLVRYAGAEVVLSVLEEIHKAPVYTLFYRDACIDKIGIDSSMVFPTFLQNIPFIEYIYRNFLPLYPLAIKSWQLEKYDVIVSSSHAVAKGFKKSENQIHVSYCHTPMRYIWDMYDNYSESLPAYKRPFFKSVRRILCKWDLESSKNVDFFLANSKFVAERIKKIYKRNATVIYPPVDLKKFNLSKIKDDFYIFVGRIVNVYKKVDVVVKAFNLLGKKLVVVGDGFDLRELRKKARSNIYFTGWLPSSDVANLMARAKALIIPSKDDFGIVSVEAQACGTPVIAFREGGVKETVIDGVTGIFFDKQTPESLINAVQRFEVERDFDPYTIRKNAFNFSKEKFIVRFISFMQKIGVDLNSK